MTTKQTEEGNRLIKVFKEGASEDDRFRTTDYWLNVHNYHESWSLLMPVVEKIESLPENIAITITKSHYRKEHECIIASEGNSIRFELSDKSKIKAVWLAVTDFIKWYNEHNTLHPEDK